MSITKGYWYWTWKPDGVPPSETNLSLAFSGYADVDEALQNSEVLKGKLVGEKFLSIGGGNAAGAFNSDRIKKLTMAINADKLADYDGIAYDIEEGDSGLGNLFAESFKAAKAKGLKVLVTVSHSAPYGIPDAASLMEGFFADENIDIMSPQLYTTGQEPNNDYETSQGVSWSAYKNCKAAIAPSIVKADMYENAVEYFKNTGIQLDGDVQWSQNA